ncbi:MAG: oligoendopeptidase F [Clostridiales Family XIII bacterium]|jgi:oligoendopeptidase F|nr:oligoendopeptidase F [Clostridiales Family XIII bacterium]
MSKETMKRADIPDRYKWDIASMYKGDEAWEVDAERAEREAERYARFSGRLCESAGTLLAALEEKDALWQLAERVFVYARMSRDEDNRDARRQAVCDRAQTLMSKISAALSFFTPEFLSVPEDVVWGFAEEEKGLGKYSHVFRVLFREKAHVLSEAEESLLAQLSEVTGATGDIFGMINNADMTFGFITDEDGDETELTHGRYIGFMESRNRSVRKAAFTKMYDAYIKQRNTLAATYSFNTKTDVVMARIRRYPSALEAALSGDNIPLSVYDNLINSVNGKLNALHRYLDIKRRLLGADELHMYDVYAPVTERKEEKLIYEDALDIMRDGLAVLGEEYIDAVSRGIGERWIDVFENEGKTSGAYSFGSYDSKPFIMLNYNEKLKDLFTIVHEMGHSVHSWYTRKTQPFVYGGHSIFTAEVASTVNESLLMHYLIGRAKNPDEKKYLVNMHIEEFRTTLFRQTMFAEFERTTHAAVENGEALTADRLSKEYLSLNKKYFGDAVVSDDVIAAEWSRIPHFYRAFYVYKYATGYSAATAIAKRLIDGGTTERDAYISFLKSGESDDPLELLKIAGVDMSASEPVERAMDTFESLVDLLESLI